jgi:hypothetical protein
MYEIQLGIKLIFEILIFIRLLLTKANNKNCFELKDKLEMRSI